MFCSQFDTDLAPSLCLQPVSAVKMTFPVDVILGTAENMSTAVLYNTHAQLLQLFLPSGKNYLVGFRKHFGLYQKIREQLIPMPNTRKHQIA